MTKIFFTIICLWCFGQVYSQLILTPLLNAGQYIQAQQESRVNFAAFGDVESYSAFFQVAADANANLFFWFFPSTSNTATDPIILCLQGGPGISGSFMLFLENGPFEISAAGDITNRMHTWTSFSNVLYIDSPVNVGYSHTNAGTEVTNGNTIANHLLQALLQFYQLFPNLQTNELFIVGESYGGKYAPTLANTIHRHNEQSTNDINLKGIAIGNGITDPMLQSGYGQYLYQIGLIDHHVKAIIDDLELVKYNQMASGDYGDALTTWSQILGAFKTNAGYDVEYHYLHTNNIVGPQEAALDVYLNGAEVRAALHVGNVPYLTYNGSINVYLTDYFNPVSNFVEQLLNDNYKVLVYNGQMDVMIPHILWVDCIKQLNFIGVDEYRNGSKHIWRVGTDIAGYVRKGGNLYEALVRVAGHNSPRDQPAWVSDLIQRFVFNRPMWDETKRSSV